MSKTQLKHVIDKELERLNERIDLKILEGESYQRDAKRHQMLLSQIKHLRRKEWLNRFTRSFRTFRFTSLF